MDRFGLPRDAVEVAAAIGAALALVFARPFARALGDRSRVVIALAAFVALALSAGYVSFYLRGGPRIIDATSYDLEARALAHGDLAFAIGEPASSVLGRFLVRTPDARAAVIFPPGYPAILAIGFLVGAPLAVGPVLAAALAFVTARLARALFPDRPSIAPLAAITSALSAALRYHTADTMSHGLAALCFASALVFAFEAKDTRARRSLLFLALAGLALGWLAATRPPSALALALVLAFVLAPELRARPLRALALAFGLAPGLALLAAHAHAATGSWLGSAQRAYYAVADGPPGCFRYGFGSGVGCVAEHGDFVRAHLERGFGVVEAIGTTARRLKAHLVDAGNSELATLALLYGARRAFDDRRARVAVLAIVAIVLAYAPFYFDGNYPAGGARFFADVLPIEHVLLALAAIELGERTRVASFAGASLVALLLLGFASRAGRDHAALRDREGGRPMFERAVVAAVGDPRALVFFDTDHGFDLAFDPSRASLDAVRFKGDALDRFAWEARGRPNALRYRFDFATGAARVEPYAVDAIEARRIEGESLWPPLEQRAGFAIVRWATGTCASAGRVLALEPGADIVVELPAAPLAGHAIAPRVFVERGARAQVMLEIDGKEAASWSFDREGCSAASPANVPLGASRATFRLTRDGAAPGVVVGLDAVEIDPR